ncbi:MAG: hypothetical protein ACOX19_07010 [Fermentimonas sp.]
MTFLLWRFYYGVPAMVSPRVPPSPRIPPHPACHRLPACRVSTTDNPVNGTAIAFAPERWRQWCRRLFVNVTAIAFAPRDLVGRCDTPRKGAWKRDK